MLALNRQMCATSVTLSYFHVHTAINILRCFGYPREHNFGLVLILSPTGCTEGCVYFPQSCRNTHLPHFLDCLLNTTLIPCLLVCFLSILHERVCDYSGVQSSVTGILQYTAKYPRVCNRMWASTSRYRPVYVALQTWKSTCCVRVVYTDLCSTDTVQVWYRSVIRVGNRCVIILTVYKLYLHVYTMM